MKKEEMEEYLQKQIERLLYLENIKINFPQYFILDDDENEATEGIALECRVTNDGTVSDVKILVNKKAFCKNDFIVKLSHELGHIVAFSKRIYLPFDSFLNIFRNEKMADEEGINMLVSSGGSKYEYIRLFWNNCANLLKNIIYVKEKGRFFLLVKCLIVNVARIFNFFVFSFAKKEKFY